MAILGKIIGGIGGFVVGGPLGALVGTAAGHAVDRMRSFEDDASDATRQTAFTIAVIALSAKMAKADGQVTPDEVRAFRQILDVPEDELKNVARVFDVARKDARGFEPYAKQVAKMFADRPAVLEELLDALFHIAKADRIVHPQEEKFLQEVGRIFGFDEAKFARIRAGHLGADVSDPYIILGVAHDADNGEVQRAWRTLIKENHPDKLIADGMPQDFIDVATAKMATINDAWSKIQKQRGLT
ncbi:MAG: TerB family tellurite resistance protein [Pseudomonadota bacterium]|nr:TerB family tellurite resistance protein [Pseudomonadota bacterium]